MHKCIDLLTADVAIKAARTKWWWIGFKNWEYAGLCKIKWNV